MSQVGLSPIFCFSCGSTSRQETGTNKPDEENEEAESGKDRGEGDENQVTKVFGGRREEKDLQKVGQYHISFLSTQYNV